MLNEAIHKALSKAVLHPELSKVMDYAVFPAGKLFRPRLVEALSLDLNHAVTDDHLHLAAAIELHHAYTLVHDDLPAMDNDLIRRGKPSTHAHFGEWKGILGGDALLIASFGEVMNIESPYARDIHKLMTWATGAKGLILGQFLDLGADGKMTSDEVVRIHELKTARLIQLATLGSYYLSHKISLRGKIEFLRLGQEIGVSFQLLDDLSDLTEKEVSPHEMAINPFISNEKKSLAHLQKSHERLKHLLEKHGLQNVGKMLQDYFKKNQKDLLEKFTVIERNTGKEQTALKNWLTTYV